MRYFVGGVAFPSQCAPTKQKPFEYALHCDCHSLARWSSPAIMDSHSSSSPAARPTVLEDGRQHSNNSNLDSEMDGAGGSGHITMEEPRRPNLYKRSTMRGESTKSIREALRLSRAREEQETLLGEEELADDDGCYPPRQSDAPRVPNPHRGLPIYVTIHKIRRLVLASIGRVSTTAGIVGHAADIASVRRRPILCRTAQVAAHERRCHTPACGPPLRSR